MWCQRRGGTRIVFTLPTADEGAAASASAPRAVAAAQRPHVPRARVDERLRSRRSRRLGGCCMSGSDAWRSTRFSTTRSGTPRRGSRSRRSSRSFGEAEEGVARALHEAIRLVARPQNQTDAGILRQCCARSRTSRNAGTRRSRDTVVRTAEHAPLIDVSYGDRQW